LANKTASAMGLWPAAPTLTGSLPVEGRLYREPEIDAALLHSFLRAARATATGPGHLPAA